MATKILAISDPRVLAEFVRQDEFKAFFEKRLEVPPDYMGLLIRNGQFVQAYKGAHLSVGGLAKQLMGIIGGSQSISLLLADLKPFPIEATFSAITKDKLQIAGTVFFEAQVNPEKPENILGMMEGRKAITKEAIAARLRGHLQDRVYEASVSRMNASEVRGNTGLQDLIQADAMKEVERVFGQSGVMIRAVSVEWGINEVEKAEIKRKAAEREAEAVEFEFSTLKRQMEREQESTVLKIAAKQDLAKLDLTNEAELQRLVLSQEIDFVDARESGKRAQEMAVLQHEITMLKTERLAKFDAAIAKATHEGVDLALITKRSKEITRETEELDVAHEIKLKAMRKRAEREEKAGDRDDLVDDAEAATRAELIKLKAQIAKDEAELGKLKGLSGLDAEEQRRHLEAKLKEAESKHQQDMDRLTAGNRSKLDMLNAASRATPEQILAVLAADAPHVAKVIEEQAKAKAANESEAKALLQQMVKQATDAGIRTEQQALAMFSKGMDGAAGVAAGAGPKSTVVAEAGATMACPKCGTENKVGHAVCKKCRAPLTA